MNTMTTHRFTKGTPAANMTDPGQRPATPRQIEFLVDLVKQIAEFDKERGTELWLDMRARQAQGLVFTVASDKINEFKALRTELRMAKAGVHQSAQARPEVPEGRYAVDTDEGHLGFYQVKVADNGFVTVSVQASNELHQLPWKAALGVLRKIEVDPQAAAIRYGKELGVCGVCARPLTNPESRAAGIGPKCASRF